MAKRELQPINAGSMADIAFLLLIFFLVATTMDSDTGLLRLLPPMPDPNAPVPESQIHDRNILQVKVNKDDYLSVKSEITQLSELRELTKNFILNPTNDPSMPEKELRKIAFFGEVMATKAVISLQNDRGTTYAVYIAVQNELIAARDELKNNLAMSTWGVPYSKLDEARQKAVDEYYNVPISEAEPKSYGGKK